MGCGRLVIRLVDGMDATLLEDLLFELKSGEHVIDTVGWEKEKNEPAVMAITFCHHISAVPNKKVTEK
jgi:hypothetical protein